MCNRKIIVVECISSAVNYIGDIRKAGFEPVVLETNVPLEQKANARKLHDYYYALNGDAAPQIMTCAESYEGTLATVKELDPVLILPGSDEGLVLATRLAFDLGLPGNDPKDLPKMRNKLIQQKALLDAGLRAIRSEVISTLEEALAFYRSLNIERVVIKPVSGGASVGVCVCGNPQEIADAVRLNHRISKCIHACDCKMLIQEYIDGEEYVLDSVFCKGEHVATFGVHYNKKLIAGRCRIYDYDEYFDIFEPKHQHLVAYSDQVCAALGLSFGAVHNEFMIDSQGPVLIEANCRTYGGMCKATYQDLVFGFHETELSLQSYLNPTQFLLDMKHLPRQKACGVTKEIIINREIFVERNLFDSVQKNLKTCMYYMEFPEGRVFPKTIDLSTSGGIFYLCGEQADVEKDLSHLHDLEQNHIEKLYQIRK